MRAGTSVSTLSQNLTCLCSEGSKGAELIAWVGIELGLARLEYAAALPSGFYLDMAVDQDIALCNHNFIFAICRHLSVYFADLIAREARSV